MALLFRGGEIWRDLHPPRQAAGPGLPPAGAAVPGGPPLVLAPVALAALARLDRALCPPRRAPSCHLLKQRRRVEGPEVTAVLRANWGPKFA